MIASGLKIGSINKKEHLFHTFLQNPLSPFSKVLGQFDGKRHSSHKNKCCWKDLQMHDFHSVSLIQLSWILIYIIQDII